MYFFLQNPKFAASDFTWWRGLARILEERGFILEGDEMVWSYSISHIIVFAGYEFYITIDTLQKYE